MNEDTKKDYGVLIAKKSEKLVTALYLVTDLMSDNEPIKHGLRKNAVSLLSSMNALAQLDVKDRVLELKVSLRAVTEITSLLHVALTTGICSKMNGELLMEGFRSLQLVLEKKQPIFTKDMLHVENEEMLTASQEGFQKAVSTTSYDALTPLSLARLHDSHEDVRKTEDLLRQEKLLERFENKRQSFVQPQKDISRDHYETKSAQQVPGAVVRGVTQSRTEESSKDNYSAKNVSTHALLMEQATRPMSGITSSFQMKKHSRREQILALFVKGVDVSIKDIAARIKGCSEKTIQRELNTLLYDNVIERIGEKRWSRYVLK